jgi:hypothetical protein
MATKSRLSSAQGLMLMLQEGASLRDIVLHIWRGRRVRALCGWVGWVGGVGALTLAPQAGAAP